MTKLTKEQLEVFVDNVIESHSHITWDEYESFSPQVQENSEIIKLLFNDTLNNFQKLPEHIKNDKNIMGEVLKLFPSIYDHFSEDLKKDENLAVIMINHSSNNVKKINENLLDNKKVIIETLMGDSCLLEYASERLRNDWDIITIGAKNQGGIYVTLDAIGEEILKEPEKLVSLNFPKFLSATSLNGLYPFEGKDTIAKRIYDDIASNQKKEFALFLEKEFSKNLFKLLKFMGKAHDNKNLIPALNFFLSFSMKHWSESNILKIQSNLDLASTQNKEPVNQFKKILEQELKNRKIKEVHLDMPKSKPKNRLKIH
jgi:hypothetical protein